MSIHYSLSMDKRPEDVLSLPQLIKRNVKLRRINKVFKDPVYLAALDCADFFDKKLDQALIEYINQVDG